MNQQLPVYLSEGVMLLFLSSAFIVIVAANIYDIFLKTDTKSVVKAQAKLRGPGRPFITVLVYAYNDDNFIESCLDSIRRNRYSRCDVVVVNNASSDGTRRKVRLYQQKYPLCSIRLYSKRQHGARAEVLHLGYGRSQQGELVIVVDASSVIPNNLVKSSAARFVSDSRLNVLHFNIYNTNSHSITSLYYRFLQLSESLFRKFFSIILKYKIKKLEGGSMYRRSVFREACKLSFVAGEYDSGLMVADYSVNSDKSAILRLVSWRKKWLDLPVVIVAILLQTYSIYIAATLQSTTLLIVGWLAVALWLLLTTWSAEAVNISDRIKLTFCMPIVYFLVYVQLFTYVIATIIAAVSLLGGLIIRLARSPVS